MITAKQHLASHYYELDFKLAPGQVLEFFPGHHLSLKVEEGRYNSYSITTVPDELPNLSLCIDVIPAGPGSRFVVAAKPGQTAEFLAPLGRYGLSNARKPALFVATGSGISPLRAMMQSRLKSSSEPVVLYWGLRLEADIFWLNIWQAWQVKYPHFRYELCLSRSTNQWSGREGYVTEAIKTDFLDLAAYEAYLCGNKQMIEDVTKLLLKKGLNASEIYTEKFF